LRTASSPATSHERSDRCTRPSIAGETDEHAEVGDGLDLARHLVATVEVLGELLPRVLLALLQAERDATTLFIHVEHHDFDFLARVHDLGRVDVLVGPVHFGDVDQAFDAVLDLHERAVVGDVRDLAEHAGVRGITAGDVLPRIRAELLQAQRDTRTLAVELEDADVDLVADLHHFRRVLDALPRHVGDVQQAVDATEVDESAVVGEVLDGALEHGAFLQVVHERAALGGELLLHDRATRHDHVVALLIELDDLELERLAFEVGGITHGTHVDERTREERAHVVDLDGEAALHAARDGAGDDLGLVERFFQAGPGAGALGLLAGEPRFTAAVFHGVERDFNAVTSLDFDLSTFVLELFERDDRFGLEAHVDDDHVTAYVDDEAGEDHAGADALVSEALFEELGKRFSH
jgi:hypothetical protein